MGVSKASLTSGRKLTGAQLGSNEVSDQYAQTSAIQPFDHFFEGRVPNASSAL
jgi:hypothetical protein